MTFLVILVSLIFAFIFYFFYIIGNNMSLFGFEFSSNIPIQSISGNLLLETIIFIIIAIIFYIHFSNFKLKENIIKNKDKDLLELKDSFSIFNYINKEVLLKKGKKFFKNYLYYIGFLFAYFAIFLIFKSLDGGDFAIVIFSVNIIVSILFFVSNKFFVFRDFMRVNTVLFSLIYIYFYLNNFLLGNMVFPLYDLLNSIILFIFFILTFYNDKKILKHDNVDNVLLIYLFVYSYVFFLYFAWVLVDVLFISVNILLLSIYVSMLFNIVIYYIITNLNFFKNNIITLRVISFLFSYISSILIVFYLLKYGLTLFILLNIIYLIIFHFFIHNKFQNYISFFFSYFHIIFLIYFLYYQKVFYDDDGIFFLVGSLVLSLESIIFTYFYKFKYNFDYYFFHVFSYILNFFSIIFFLIFFKLDMFILGIIFLVESVYIFLSFYKLKHIELDINILDK